MRAGRTSPNRPPTPKHHWRRAGYVCAILALLSACGDSNSPDTTLDPQEITATLTRVSDWALATPQPFDPRYWVMAPLYDGLIDSAEATGNPLYLAAVLRAGRRIDFTSGSRTYHADGHAAGRSWLRLYLMDPKKDPAELEPFKEQFDEIVANPITQDLVFGKTPPKGLRITDRWSWADALYMSPPTIVILAQATGDKRYLAFMASEYQVTYRALFDTEDNLFYRDATYIGDRSPNGEKLFWSRGNGWVYAGLALVLDALPMDDPARPFYVDLFQRMSVALRNLQQADGFWYPSLKDPQQVPSPETSGTAFFVLGMATGIRLGLIDGSTYWPTVEKGWRAILTAIGTDGSVNFVQPVGEVPKPFDPASRVPFGTGPVLGAGAAILAALQVPMPKAPDVLFTEADALVPTAPDLSSVCERPCGKPEPREPDLETAPPPVPPT